MYPSRTADTTAALVAVLIALMVACGGAGKHPGQESGTATSPPPAATPAVQAAGMDWEDPEPPEAQALAEAVLHEPFNADKTTRLAMRITTLSHRTSGIQGFATLLEPEEATLADRLSALGAEETETEVTIRLPGAILFDFDSAEIRPDAERTLNEVVKVLASYPDRPVRIEGHTDAIASEAYNQRLAEARAESVARWLTAHGVQGGRLRSSGWGETRPVADNSTPQGRQRNRRVEIVIEKNPPPS